MTIQVALHHKSHYVFDRQVVVSPHEIRLRPAAHSRTPISSYSLNIKPAKHFVHWQQDAYGNFVARITFPFCLSSEFKNGISALFRNR